MKHDHLTHAVAVALLCICGIRSTRADEAAAQASAPVPPPQTELGKLAANLKPGEMKELKTRGYDHHLLKSWYDWEEDNIKAYGSQKMFNIVASWSHDACWDPKTQQVLFIGIGHYASLKFVTYSAISNAWTLMPVPTWCDPRHPEKQFKQPGRAGWPRGHTYDRLAISPAHRLFAINWNGLYLYNIDSNVWSRASGSHAAGKDAYQVCEYFPERNAFVYESDWGKRLRAWDPDEQSQRGLGSYPFGMHGAMEYNPVYKVLIFGGGDRGDTGCRTFYRIDAQGKIEKLKPAAAYVTCREGSKLLCDPVSGEYVAQDNRSRKVYAFHPIRDVWKEIEGLKFPAGLGVAVDTYGVLMFCGVKKVWIYKHSPQWPPEAEQASARAGK